MWIKICGMTTAEAVRAAADAGVDAIGFVFAPSKRQLSVAQAAELARHAPSGLLRIAVMQHPSQSLVEEVCTLFKPDFLQTDFEDLAVLQTRIPVLPVVRAGRAVPSPMPQRILFEGPVSGTGQTADWSKAAQLVKQTQLILAGGLNPANVGEAIVKVRPFGVDVSSGVESSPGVKSVERIAEFVSEARKALTLTLSPNGERGPETPSPRSGRGAG